ncbi:hypothetical protein BaRGS_00022155 [Batillaria attramentaria]|uniref:Carboxylic ester hydrolase n=1 Tax=Batillaria attramentaria TaxID=370345 RepID=A0ABD0KHF4_9CAEN
MMLPRTEAMGSVLTVAVLLMLSCRCDGQARVRVNGATVTGQQTTVSQTTLWKFLGIRYAQAPSGLQRFQRPTAVTMNDQVDATRYGARCPTAPLQGDMSEDCLFLNVFVPRLRATGQRLPVFVWIHGGGFVTGSANNVEADVLAAEGGIIVVTFNYRLGPLGFLATGDNTALGNYGLWDQRMALRWVRNYISFFGGDTSRVTLGGMSAGAASASMLSLSPRSRDLFQRVIQLSGSALSPWARVSHSYALDAAKRLATKVGCLTPGISMATSTMVGCLRNTQLSKLISASSGLWNDTASALLEYVWVPVTDGDIAMDVTSAEPFQGPLLAGLVNNEGGLLEKVGVRRVSSVFPDVQTLLTDRDFYREKLLPAMIRQSHDGDVSPQAVEVVECAYGSDRSGDVGKEEVVGAFGDQAFVYTALEYLNHFSNYQPSYLYYMDHQPDRPGIEGVRHGDDQAYLFAFMPSVSEMYNFPPNVSKADRQLSRDLRHLVVNFVKTGDPNKPNRPQSWPLWPLYTPKQGNYMVMSSSPRVASHLREDYMGLWLDDIPSLLTSHNVSDTWSHCLTSSAGGRPGVSMAVSSIWGLALLCFLVKMAAQ